MNITVGEIIKFVGTVMWISIGPQNMGGYLSHFVKNTMIHLGYRYFIQLEDYYVWAKDFMTIIIFKQIQSTFFTEGRTYFYGGIICNIVYACLMINKNNICSW